MQQFNGEKFDECDEWLSIIKLSCQNFAHRVLHNLILGVYCIVQNVGSGKHWRILLKTTLAKNIGDCIPHRKRNIISKKMLANTDMFL